MIDDGKLVMESIVETKASTILQFVQGLHGDLHVTFEEGTWTAWLYDLMKPHVTELVVCDPRKNALLRDGNKSDKIDARELAEKYCDCPREGTQLRRPRCETSGPTSARLAISLWLRTCVWRIALEYERPDAPFPSTPLRQQQSNSLYLVAETS
jgi:hypothetical protein